MTGQKFGRLTVVERAGSIRGLAAWLCRCECGGEVVVPGASLRSGNTSSCGCINRDNMRNNAKDLTGQRFGKLTVLKRQGSNRHGKATWLCQCDCGMQSVVATGQLTSGMTQSCGCLTGRPGGFLDLTGKRFGKLTVIELTDKHWDGCNVWRCKCDCGNETEQPARALSSGGRISCGCAILEAIHEKNTTHGMSGMRLYRIWSQMKARCNNPDQDNHHSHWEYGINYLSDWDEFEPFMRWALSSGYDDSLSLDRINPFKDYTPENLRWAGEVVQANNKREHYYDELRQAKIDVYSAIPHCIRSMIAECLEAVFPRKFWNEVFSWRVFNIITDSGLKELRSFLSCICDFLAVVCADCMFQFANIQLSQDSVDECFRWIRVTCEAVAEQMRLGNIPEPKIDTEDLAVRFRTRTVKDDKEQTA